MTKYSFDTSALLDAWIRYYPIDIFSSFWKKFNDFNTNGVCKATDLVRHELLKKDDGCITWFKNNSGMDFFEELNDEIQFEVSQILTNPNHQRLIEERKGILAADPFVIAHAKINNLTLVTGERATRNPSKPKIPDVCLDLNIDCIDIRQFMRKENWTF